MSEFKAPLGGMIPALAPDLGTSETKDPRVMPPYAEQINDIKDAKRSLDVVFGDSGTPRWAGYYFTDYNALWENRERFEIVEKMRRGDADVKALLKALKSPLLAAKWDIKVDSDDPKDTEIRDFVRANLMEGMERSWMRFLREALSYLDFGVYPFELLWTMRNGKVWLKDLSPRIPRSILRWRTTDGKFGIQQMVLTDEFSSALPEIPASKLCIFTHEQEGDDITGISVLRPAFKHWDMKETHYRIQVIASERYGVGVPVYHPGKETVMTVTEKAAITQALQNLRSNEKAYIVLTRPDDKLEILTPNGSGMGTTIQDAIEHHSKMIPISILANFLTVGRSKGQGGGRSQSEDLSDFFTLILSDIASYICETVNKQVIEKMVKVNFGEREKYPKLFNSEVGGKDLASYATALSTLAGANLIDVNPSAKIAIRKEVGLPDYTEEQEEALREKEIEDGLREIEASAGITGDEEGDEE